MMINPFQEQEESAIRIVSGSGAVINADYNDVFITYNHEIMSTIIPLKIKGRRQLELNELKQARLFHRVGADGQPLVKPDRNSSF